MLRIVHRVITRFLLKQAAVKRCAADTGAVTLIQRFGSAANLNIPLHCPVLDGVYRRTEAEPEFQEARAPTRAEWEGLLDKIITRLMRMLTGLGYRVEEQGVSYLADIDIDNPLMPLQAASCTYRIALGPRAGQKVLSLRTVPGRDEKTTPALCAQAHGFSLHAGVRCGAHQRKALERLCRYITRPACRQRTAQAQWRRRCRAATEERLSRRHHAHRHVAAGIHAAPGRAGAAAAPASDPLPRPRWRPMPGCVPRSCRARSGKPGEHPEEHARAPARMSWARLLKRVFDIDVEHCPQGGGDLKIIAAIEEPAVIVRILTHLGLPARAPPRAPARPLALFRAA